MVFGLGFGAKASAADYYVRTDGNDTNTGLANDSGHAWLTVGKAWNALYSAGGTHTVHIQAGNYYNETYKLGGPASGQTLTFQGEGGTVTLRIRSDSAQAYTFRTSGSGGTAVWNNIIFDQATYGDTGGVSSNRFFYDIGGNNWEFNDCEMFGSNIFGSFGGTGRNVTFRRSKLHDFTSYPFNFANHSNNITLEAVYIYNVPLVYITINGNIAGTVSIKNSTLPAISGGAGTNTYTNVIVQNNIIYGAGAGIGFDAISGTATIDHNIIYNPTPSSPRTSYGEIGLVAGGGVSTDYIQNAYGFDPGFSTAPALLSTSFALCRGTNAGVATGINGVAFDNANCPTIGAWAPSSGVKQMITPTAKKIMVVGDSFTYGSGSSSGGRYTDLLKNDSDLADFSWVYMPGRGSSYPNDQNLMLGIYGTNNETTHYMAQEFAVSEAPDYAILLIGVNDMATKSNANIVNQISATLDALADIGIPPSHIIYAGTQIKSASATNPDVANTNAIETAVGAYCETKGYRYARTSHKTQKVTNWNADVGGLFSADDLHPNNTGYALIKEVIKPQLLAQYAVDGDNATLSYKDYHDFTNYKYGLVIAGDNATVNNLSISGFANDGILVQASSPTIKNTISSGNGTSSGNNVRQSLTGATLTVLTEDYNNFRSSLLVNGSDPGDAAHSQTADPLFTSSTNLSPVATSITIDAGTPIAGLTSDYAGNPIYGTPDIGGYEYQPTHDMGAPTPDEPQIGETIRVYGDGKFRNTIDDSEANTTDTAKLSIVPQASEITKWLDLNIATWNTSGDRRKTWTENGDNLEEGDEIVNTLHTIGDLVSGQAYSVRIDDALATGNITGANCVSGVCTADENGEIAFTYTGGYSNHTFDIKDQTAPAVNIISPETGDTVSTDDAIAFTNSETTSPKCSLNNSGWTNCQNLVTNFNDLTGWNDIAEKDTFTLYLKDTDAANNTGTDQVDNLTKADTQAPIRSNGSPSGELAAGTTSVTLGLKTDENATCRYDTAPKNYDDMVNTFTTTGEKTHSQTITSLTPEISYSYYVRCQDGSNNRNDTDYLISFSVANEEITDNDDNAERDINVNKVKAVSDQSSITLTWKTDHNTKSTIRYGTNKNLKEKKKDNQKEKNHKVTLKNLLPDTKYYFRIKSEDGNDNTDSSKIHSIKTQPKEISKSQNTSPVQNETTISNDSRIGNTVPNVCSYTVQAGDTLWRIAEQVYGDAKAYPLIIEKNKDKYPNIASGLLIGQELTFGCVNENQGAVNGASDTKDTTQSNNQETTTPETPPDSGFRWWNPFTWF